MSTLIPLACSCHRLQLPPTEKDDRQNLLIRTGSSSTLYNSLILVFGGLTIGLELTNLSIQSILSVINSEIKRPLSTYLSGELFYLRLIDRTWRRVSPLVDHRLNDGISSAIDRSPPSPSPRLLHEICAINNCVYIFGGLILQNNTLTPCNDLWEFNLQTSVWKLLHDGKDWEFNLAIPQPRYSHKLTEINSLTFVNQADHFGLFIAGGKDSNSHSIYDNYCFDLVDKKYVGQDIHLKVNDSLVPDLFNLNEDNTLNVNYIDSIIINAEDIKSNISSERPHPLRTDSSTSTKSPDSNANLIVYSSTKNKLINPLLSFKVSKHIKSGKPLPLHKNRSTSIQNKPIQVNSSTIPSLGTSVSIPNLINADKHNSVASSTVPSSAGLSTMPTSAASSSIPNLNSTNKSITTSISKSIPYNLKYPTGGLFGQNIVITGFLPNELDISIFVFNIPTGKWSRLNIFCNHDYGSHRFWGGFAWQSHHKVVLIGNFNTSKTTSSIRYFTTMITVSLPITNVLASSELAHSKQPHQKNTDNDLIPKKELSTSDEKQTTESDSSSSHIFSEEEEEEESSNNELDDEKSTKANQDSTEEPTTDDINIPISFNEYAHYAAPKTKTSTIRSVFPPAAITLGRNALERYGDLISDFELISSTGERIPVSLTVLIERWGKYFIRLLAKGYVKAVDKFDLDISQDKSSTRLRTSKSSLFSSSSSKLKNSVGTISGSSYSSDSFSSDDQLCRNSLHKIRSESEEEIKLMKRNSVSVKEKPPYHLTMPIMTAKQQPKDVPQFRLPFQDAPTNLQKESKSDPISIPTGKEPKSVSISGSPQKINPSFLSADFPPRRGSTGSYSINHSSLLNSHFREIPQQLPMPNEPIPPTPSTPISFKSPSWRGSSSGIDSPRASLLHTLTTLRNIPASKSPRESPFASPRASISEQGNFNLHHDSVSLNLPITKAKQRSKSIDGSFRDLKSFSSLSHTHQHNLISQKKHSASSGSLSMAEGRDRMSTIASSVSNSSTNTSLTRVDSEDFHNYESESSSVHYDHQEPEENHFGNQLLNFDGVESGTFKMEPSLIPRKLYIPFSTITLKAFTEYLYTGQVGNKWLLVPTALDNLAIGRFFNVPLLYDLISEVLFGIIGRKEAYIIKEGRKLKKKYLKLQELTNEEVDPNFTFALHRYEGFLDTIDDGYLDLALLKNKSKINKGSISNSSGKNRKSSSTYRFESDEREFNQDDFNTESLTSRSKQTSVEPNSLEPSISPKLSVEGSQSFFSREQSPTKSEKSNFELSSNKSSETQWNENNPYFPKVTIDDNLEDFDKLTSASEEDDDFGLGFLRSTFVSATINPRSKSVYDEAGINLEHATVYENGEETNEPDDEEVLAGLLLEQLVSPYAPVPVDIAIDAIYESATLVTDLKLMLRAANAREMAATLAHEKETLGEAIKDLKLRYEKQKQQRAEENLEESNSESSSIYGETKRNHSASSLSSAIPRAQNSSELSQKSRPSGLTRLAPFSLAKAKTQSGFNEFDRKISRLRKKNEKEKAKHDREERAKVAKSEKSEKVKLEKQYKLDKFNVDRVRRAASSYDLSKSPSSTQLDSASIASTQTSIGSKKHGFFHLGHRKKTREDSAALDETLVGSELKQTISPHNSIHSDASKQSSVAGSKNVKNIFGFSKRT